MPWISKDKYEAARRAFPLLKVGEVGDGVFAVGSLRFRLNAYGEIEEVGDECPVGRLYRSLPFTRVEGEVLAAVEQLLCPGGCPDCDRRP
jgi:hypothetical protein